VLEIKIFYEMNEDPPLAAIAVIAVTLFTVAIVLAVCYYC
jgi:hypothetical protein